MTESADKADEAAFLNGMSAHMEAALASLAGGDASMSERYGMPGAPALAARWRTGHAAARAGMAEAVAEGGVQMLRGATAGTWSDPQGALGVVVEGTAFVFDKASGDLVSWSVDSGGGEDDLESWSRDRAFWTGEPEPRDQ